ncbi:hypothetical protein DUI87_16839 [Hirundo rustica rustica]|uniref:Uncharacterized protein n=1 Tax=Hirundo rustica rustica TaxID=333673 RepID=A0A3M0K7S1_HIRRU|nr:hypothetical protein DUI87_16839 [Hirundo rustica rustica]
MVRQMCPCSTQEVRGGEEICLQLLEDPMLELENAQRRVCPLGKPVLEQVGRTCGSLKRRAHVGAALLAGLRTIWELTLKQPVPEGLHTLEVTHVATREKESCP